ncbi:unnamed protein product [Protopolystoma xenopodis]|uniref:Uncharacterized protein n=1 Tax=Protopolystoma xenopodis TaxID=117903 RepID=A0A3S5AKV5_9PLAT|nr:unnamed protein product [Protopolystoma xenopodis]
MRMGRVSGQMPGRVATLVPSRQPNSRVWGVAFEINGREEIDAALEHLAEREMITGGYRFDQARFHSLRLRKSAGDIFPVRPEASGTGGVASAPPAEVPMEMFVQVYIAEPGNRQYVGDAPLDLQVIGPLLRLLQKKPFHTHHTALRRVWRNRVFRSGRSQTPCFYKDMSI